LNNDDEGFASMILAQGEKLQIITKRTATITTKRWMIIYEVQLHHVVGIISRK
jgi:hypothetical protein